MSNKLKVKPYKSLGHLDFKEIEVSTKSWNMESRKTVNKLVAESQDSNSPVTEFDAYCKIIETVTTLPDEEVFKLSDHEIQAIGIKVIQEFSKKK